MVNWSAHTKHILPFNSNNTTQVKTKVRKASIDENKGAWEHRRVRRLSMMGKARRRQGTQGPQFSRLGFSIILIDIWLDSRGFRRIPYLFSNNLLNVMLCKINIYSIKQFSICFLKIIFMPFHLNAHLRTCVPLTKKPLCELLSTSVLIVSCFNWLKDNPF